ncbi:hypothetical protein GCM10027597_18200 [Saccharopolyspora tripterygii]
MLDVPLATDVAHARVDQCTYTEGDHATDEVPSDHNHHTGTQLTATNPAASAKTGSKSRTRLPTNEQKVPLVDYRGGKL